MMWRFGVFLATIVVAIGSYIAYDRFHVPGRFYPPEDLINSTLYGPVLFVSIPVSLGWAFLAAQKRWVRVLGLSVASLLLAICVIWMTAMQFPKAGL
jgi:hypothetical protein